MARNKYPEITEERILEAAERLFLEKGFEQTTIQDIVDALGDLTKGAVYHHFKSKEEIMDAVSDRMFLRNNPFVEASKRSDLNGLEKIRESIRLNQGDEERRAITVQSMPILENPHFLAGMIKENQQTLVPYLRKFIEEGIQDGSIHTQYPQELAEVMILLTGLWMVPDVYPASAAQMLRKFQFIGELLERMGLPLVDEAMLQDLKPYFEELEKVQHKK